MTHPSRLTLDLALIGAAPADDAAHIAACDRCRAVLAGMTSEREAFLRAHPKAPRRSQWKLGAATMFAAAAIILLAILIRPAADRQRMKGDTRAELWIKRGQETFKFDGRPLQQGDTLAFRYTTQRTHLTVLDAEASGKIEVVIDQAIEPGSKRTASKG